MIDRTGRRLIIVAVVIIVAGVTAGRSIWVSLYGVDIPFYDQWSQAIEQLVPLKQGTLQYSEYLSPHNEHRILFTRLISMALFKINGGTWSNLVEAYANTVIYSATMAWFYVLACRGANRSICLIMLVAVAILSVMPYDWENNLVGFQNQFYFMIAFAIALAGIASYRRPHWTTVCLITAAAVASLFTMASGLLGAVIVCVVIVIRAWREPLPKAYIASVAGAMTLVALCGLLLLPNTPQNDAYKAYGIAEHAHAIATALIWPLVPSKPKHFLLALLIWAPSVLWSIKFLKTRAAKDREIFLMGIVTWVIFQILAIAHARGHSVSSISSRYSNICALGVLANLALALSLASDRRLRTSTKYLSHAALALGMATISFIFVQRTPRDMDDIQQRYDFSRMEVFYTQSYLVSKDPIFLQHSSLAIPYPDAALLKSYLGSSVVENLLPPTLQHASNAVAENFNKKEESVAKLALDLQAAIRHAMAGIGVNTPSIFFQEVASTPEIGAKTSPIGACSVTSVNEAEITTGSIVAKGNDPLRFYGWIINPQSQIKKRFFLILIGSKRYTLEVDPFMKREDISRMMHSKPEDTLRFRAFGILPNVPSGSYIIQMTTAADHGQVICNLPYLLVVTQ